MTSLSDNRFDALTKNFRSCALSPALGTCKVHPGPTSQEEAIAFLKFIARTVGEAGSGVVDQQETDQLGGTGVSWKRVKIAHVYDFYVESLEVKPVESFMEGTNLPISVGFPGQWFIDPSVLDANHDNYFRKCEDSWKGWLNSAVQSGKYSGGISCNVLRVPEPELSSDAVDIRPLTLHALSGDGRGVDRGDCKAQAAIANAFWQTFWATGATRAERGAVFPVAFLPVDRSSKYEFQPPFHERYVTLRRRLFGRTAIVSFILEELAKGDYLVFDAAANSFKITNSYDIEQSQLQSVDVLLGLAELNRTGWVDAYTGDNVDRFAEWRELEEQLEYGDAWPYGEENWNRKVSASGHGDSDPLAKVRCAVADAAIPVKRVLPYAGCAYLYEVMLETEKLKQRGKIQDFDDELIGGTNSTFFLNFPEEYSALHSAMNEPVSLLVENGITRQIKTLKRSAFVLTRDGKASITTRVGNKLNSDVLVFEGESSSATYFDKAHESYGNNVYGPLFFGSVVVGNSIVETFEEIKTEMPPAGWIIGDSEAFGGKIDPENAASAYVPVPGKLTGSDIRHAFAIGPYLVNNGEAIPLDKSNEEFLSIKLSQALTIEETSKKARTELPSALLHCEHRGVPPTRFPYDWNVTRAPRSAIGITPEGDVLVVVVDGRADLKHSVGATLAELAEIMKALGCTEAMNMDGGGSSVMFVNHPDAQQSKMRPDLRDGVVNLPSDMGGVERLLPVPLIICKKRKDL